MIFPECKIYTDGNHYIAIPHTEKKSKKPPKNIEELIIVEESELPFPVEPQKNAENDEMGKNEDDNVAIATEDSESKPKEREITKKELFEELYILSLNKPKKSRRKLIIDGMARHFETREEATEFVDKNLERKERNLIVRRTRLCRKVNLADFNYFCTFTYDDKLHTEESFKRTLKTCFKMMCHRKNWRYVGVWERSPTSGRLHFHGLFDIPEGAIEDSWTPITDYNTTKHKRQTSYQNDYFLRRFGRNDFKPITDNLDMGNAIAYIVKYLEKTGEKIVYSKNLPQYFISDVLEDDVMCTIGQEDKKLLLFDRFSCWDEGEYVGEVSRETIAKLRKSN